MNNSSSPNKSFLTSWYNAKEYYEKSLKILTFELYPKRYLEVLEALIKVLIEIGKIGEFSGEYLDALNHKNKEIEQAEALTRQGTDFLLRLLEDPNYSRETKCRLVLKHMGLRYFSVDQMIKDQDYTKALETAERDKNACLQWFFEGWTDINQVESPSIREMRELLTEETAIIYWHQSPSALNTFLLVPAQNKDAPPLLLESDVSSYERLLKFEMWVKEWWSDYEKYKKANHKENHDWRRKMPERLNHLSNILDVYSILKQLPQTTRQLILIPHRQLHLFPLHVLFQSVRPEWIVYYLPSAKAGQINQESFAARDVLFCIQGQANGLELLDVETTLIKAQFEQLISFEIPNLEDTNRNVTIEEKIRNNFKEAEGSCHFSGHAEHNYLEPTKSCFIIKKNSSSLIELNAQMLYDVGNLEKYQRFTFSACEIGQTSLKNITSEYFGFASVLLSRGVRTVLSPLWRIDEVFSTLVMIEFYQRIRLKHKESNDAEILEETINFICSSSIQQLIYHYEEQLTFELNNRPLRKLGFHQDRIRVSDSLSEMSNEQIEKEAIETKKEREKAIDNIDEDDIPNLLSKKEHQKPLVGVRKQSGQMADAIDRDKENLTKHQKALSELIKKLKKMPPNESYNHPYYEAAFTLVGYQKRNRSIIRGKSLNDKPQMT